MDDLEELYAAYYKPLYAYCLALTRKREDAEELVAETFVRAIYSLHRCRREEEVGAFLCGIAKNVFRAELRKRRRPPPAPPPAAQSSLEDRETAQEILVQLNALDEPYRGVFLLRVVGETDYAEIARIYQRSESWARVVYHRARLKILEKLKEEK